MANTILTLVCFIVLILSRMKRLASCASDGEIFTAQHSYDGTVCTEEALLTSRNVTNAYQCANLCFRYKRQECVGVFLLQSEERCFLCSHMNSSEHLMSLQGTIAFGRQNCSTYLVKTVNDSQLSESSSHNDHPYLYKSQYARLDTVETGFGTGAWSAVITDPDPYIQVDFLRLFKVTGVVIQGRGNYHGQQWVTQYRVLTSRDCMSWQFVVDRSGQTELFPGNSDKETHVLNLFDSPVVSRCVRVNPTAFNGHPSLRFDILGCSC